MTNLIAMLACSALAMTAGRAKDNYEMVIDGKDAGQLTRYTNNTVTPTGFGKPPKPGSITIVAGPGMEPSFYNWLVRSLEGKKRASSIVTIGPDNHEIQTLTMSSALIQGITVPNLQSDSKDYGVLIVRFQPGPSEIESTTGANHPPTPGRVVWLKKDFVLRIPGIDCTHVSKIDEFHVPLTAKDRTGQLSIWLPRAAAADFLDWQVGHHKHPGTLKIKDLLVVKFYDLQISKVHTGERVRVDLSCARMEASGP